MTSLLPSGHLARIARWVKDAWAPLKSKLQGPTTAWNSVRAKLTAAFVSLALLAGLSGVVGLLTMHRIAASVSTLADATSPLLMETSALIKNAHQMRSEFLSGAVRQNASSDDVQSRLTEFEHAARQHLASAKQLAGKVDLSPKFDNVAERQNDFATTLRQMTEAYAQLAAARAKVKTRHNVAEDALKAAEKGLHQIAAQVETEIVENEERAKVEIQSGSATLEGIGALFAQTATESFPISQGVYRLMRTTLLLQHLGESAVSARDQGALSSIQAEARTALKTSTSLLKKLGSRLRASGHGTLADEANRSFATVQSAFFGSDGLTDAKDQELAAANIVEHGTSQLDHVDSLYLSALNDVEAAVRERNEAAKSAAGAALRGGESLITLLVMLTGLLALGAGLFLARKVIRPLERLTEHVSGIGKTGELTRVSEPTLLSAPDELGDLARSFDRMIADLAAARAKLIASSEAEISKQIERLEAALAHMSGVGDVRWPTKGGRLQRALCEVVWIVPGPGEAGDALIQHCGGSHRQWLVCIRCAGAVPARTTGSCR